MIEFKEDTHEYFSNGIRLISVTQLMQKHGLAPSYAGVSSETLKAKAERGSMIHKEIEEYNKTGVIGFTDELQQYIDYNKKNNVEVVKSELILYNDIVAGTCDLILNVENEPIIADIKTTYVLHREAVSWQLSIYAYLYCGDESVYNCVIGQAYHFDNTGFLNVVNIKLKPYEEIEKLMECERKGEIYNSNEIMSESNEIIKKVVGFEEVINWLDEQVKNAKAQQQEFKDALLKEMEARGLKTFEKDGVKITYVAPTTRATLDSKGVQEKYPDIYEEFKKTSEVKASLKITLKKK